MTDSTNDIQPSLADALHRLVVELDEIIDDMETSVPDEWVVPDPIRDSPLYSAVKTVERHHRDGKLPVEPRLIWIEMLCITDEEQIEVDAQASYEKFYKLCAELRKWAVVELNRPSEIVGPFTRSKWSDLLDWSERKIQDMEKHPSTSRGKIYLYRRDLPPNIDQIIAKVKSNGK